MSKYRLLALDLDGTLVGRNDQMTAEDGRAISRLHALGDVHITIVTGRLYGGTRRAAQNAGIEGPIACADGSHILTLPTEDILDITTLSSAMFLRLRDLLWDYQGLATFLMGHLDVICDDRGALFAPYVDVWSNAVRTVGDIFEHAWWHDDDQLLKTLSIGSAEDVARAAARVRAELGAEVEAVTFPITIMIEGQSALIVRKAGIDKGHALGFLARHHGCALEQTVVVGDWLNDVPMFNVAGRSFAMGQASDEIKRHATDELVSTAATGGGVAEAIAKIWGV